MKTGVCRGFGSWYVVCLAVFIAASQTSATVYISQVLINPPGSLDDFTEFIELQGTPGRSLDGYAIAFVNGTEQKFYTLNSIPPLPIPRPETDEFFSLDGLTLGPNGLLVIAIATIDNYPSVLEDTHFIGPWFDHWNGGLDEPGRLQNDGSNSIFLIRNRPGRTEADPLNPGGLRWGKHIFPDFELIRPAIDPQDGVAKDQWGDGSLDRGQHNGINGPTHDMLGFLTLAIDDDLEVVDEVSYEHERGWEYDLDKRRVDYGSNHGGLPERRVHTLDDPQGFNPDALTRVDYRTKGPGWLPAPGAVGDLPNGNNWQDTATDQWIRGETVANFTSTGPQIFYSNAPNGNLDAIQPYETNVPRWLNDGVGTNYNFSAANTYPIQAGRVNSLAVPFIPGDANRDGVCDEEDIAKIAAVFGDDDWIFSNAFGDAPEGNDGDPATQTRPWDVDATGDNGIEASDLQWTLNFQGNSNGRVVGRRYDSTTPSATGVYLNPNTSVGCTVTVEAHVPSGRSIDELRVGDLVELTVLGRVTSGARTSPADQSNGIMQFLHDVQILAGGTVRVQQIEALSPFAITRPELLQNEGFGGDRGVSSVAGYTASFTQGLSAAVPLYRVTLQAFALGATQVNVVPATLEKFALSTPHGLKVGRTDSNGNPNGSVYPAGLVVTVSQQAILPGNCDLNPQINAVDFKCLSECLTGPSIAYEEGCDTFDLDNDGDVDMDDVRVFWMIFSE